ncbi:hypothetical protein AV521_17600 [Streptomyces sp. IMTB 2501]|uniref:hypothetical protein n=1 Tax=Streptomyces sp. IMTB 2501 TaxID=1776340 RepID=UPI00096C68CA|nr:hypothetical protein [Streptomyces sp. IMTB 2501]OLZ69527.1 hypothetical protein AV521_17600 [Streptomyces sp. IMTB 2501]
MGNARRELLGAARLVLDIRDRPGPPSLRFETADDGRMLLLRQAGRPLLLGRSVIDGAPCCPELRLHRLDGYRSPLPPLRTARQRSSVNWPHEYARRLEETTGTPLSDGRWELALRTGFPPGIWEEDLVREWPGGSLGLYCGGGWHGVVPLRPLSPPDSGRVKAYRKLVREGTLAPVLLWWVTFLDGWLLLDGHDRAVAALAEGRTPHCVELTRLPAPDQRWHGAEKIHQAHEYHMERLAALPPGPGAERQRDAVQRAYGDTLAELPYAAVPTATHPLHGGAPAWRALARAAMFQFPGD